MVPSAFDEETGVIDPPPGWTPEECAPLSVYRGPLQVEGGAVVPVVVSCWKPDAQELAEINRTGRVWLIVWGATMQPAALAGVNPFGG